jgi:hypothetical protein
MALTLRDGHYFTRSMVGELEQFRWSDAFINFSLNNRAQDFCLPAGLSTWFYNVPLAAGSQEGPLPIDLDQVRAVKFFAGQLFPLQYKDWDELQTGAFTGSIPLWFYIKTDTTQLTPQQIGSDIAVIDLLPANPQGGDYRQVIGVWPILEATGNIHVWYTAYHPLMTEPQSKCMIPRPFLDGWAAGAIADCLRIEKAYSEADIWEARFAMRKEAYRVYAQTHKQVSQEMRYGYDEAPWRDSASSSVILIDQFPTGP